MPDEDTESILFLDRQIMTAQENGNSSPVHNVREKLPPMASGSQPKSNSLANEAEFARLNDQLATKKSTILDLQEKMQLVQSDLRLLDRKHSLVVDENAKLKSRGGERLEVIKLM